MHLLLIVEKDRKGLNEVEVVHAVPIMDQMDWVIRVPM